MCLLCVCVCELSCVLMSLFDHILTCHFDSVITADVGLGSAFSTNRALSHFLAVTSDALVVNVWGDTEVKMNLAKS